MTDPKRLVDDPAVPEELRRDLRRVAEHPPAYDLEAGLAKLRAAPKPSGPPVWVTPAVAALGALLGGLALWWTATSAEPAAREAAGVPAPAVAPLVPEANDAPEADEADDAPAQSPAPAPSTAGPSEPAHRGVAAAMRPGRGGDELRSDRTEPPPSRPASRARSASGDEAASVGGGLRDEIAHMARLRAAAATDPREALRLAREGRRLFRGGLFTEEREAIAIIALAELGRRDEARRRARRWLRRHPDSALRPRVRAAVE